MRNALWVVCFSGGLLEVSVVRGIVLWSLKMPQMLWKGRARVQTGPQQCIVPLTH